MAEEEDEEPQEQAASAEQEHEDAEDPDELDHIDVVNVIRYRKNYYKIKVYWHIAGTNETWLPRTIIQDFPETVWEHALGNRAPWKEEWKAYVKRVAGKLRPEVVLE